MKVEYTKDHDLFEWGGDGWDLVPVVRVDQLKVELEKILLSSTKNGAIENLLESLKYEKI